MEPLLLATTCFETWLFVCSYVRSGKVKGETRGETAMTLELSKLMELWLEESRQREMQRKKEDEQREQERQREEVRWEEKRKRYEEEWRHMEEERARRSEVIMRNLVATLTEREPRRPRTDFGAHSLKLTKLTLSDDIEVFMMTFERSMEAHEIERIKWPVLLAPQLTGKAQQTYAALSSEDFKNFTKVKEAIFKRYDINE